jgi:hypothetical protein
MSVLVGASTLSASGDRGEAIVSTVIAQGKGRERQWLGEVGSGKDDVMEPPPGPGSLLRLDRGALQGGRQVGQTHVLEGDGPDLPAVDRFG